MKGKKQTHKPGILAALMNYMAKNPTFMINDHGQPKNSFFHHAGHNSGNFKRNQRKERKLARRRKARKRS